MSQPLDLGSLFPQCLQPTKRTVFISYHHGGDQQYYNAFSKAFHDTYEAILDNSLERTVDSENPDCVFQRICEDYIAGSSCTIVLCGAETPWRKYVDWEIKATLDMQHGLIGVNLPTNAQNALGRFTVPDRLQDNIQSGFAIWTNWIQFTQNTSTVKLLIEQAVSRSSHLIVNSREMMSRNGSPPWRISSQWWS
jgi:hypothetical protein